MDTASESRVLVVVDPAAESQRAAERGARFASGLGAELELLVVVYDQFVEHDKRARESLMQHQREAAESIARSVGLERESCSIETRWGRSLADEVIRRVGEIGPELVIKDTQHHSLLRRTILSNADWDLIRECPVPLLLAKDRDLAASPAFVAAIDPTNDHDKPRSLDRRILSIGDSLRRCLGGRLRPLHVFDIAQLAGVTDSFSVAMAAPQAPVAMALPEYVSAENIDRLQSERRRLFGEVLATAGLEPEDGSLLIGDPAAQLIEFAESEQADFVVMGAVARGVLGRILIGHTAEKILDRLPCDLIVVHYGAA